MHRQVTYFLKTGVNRLGWRVDFSVLSFLVLFHFVDGAVSDFLRRTIVRMFPPFEFTRILIFLIATDLDGENSDLTQSTSNADLLLECRTSGLA